ncbi:MAG: DUF1722 domain-containing protein [Desulfopila sp.]
MIVRRGGRKDIIDEPGRQFTILGQKYQGKEQGRIPLPKTAQQLWSQHKYSILARDVNLYKRLGRQVAGTTSAADFAGLARLLTEQLRNCPASGGIRNALEHMWGYVADYAVSSRGEMTSWSLLELLANVQCLALTHRQSYLLMSTALSELKVWL